MKTKLLYLLIIAISLLSGCGKTKLVDNPPELLLQIVDETGSNISNATVELYASESDFDKRENRVAKATTDNNGEVLFYKNMQEKIYFFYAFTTEKDNMYGVITYKQPLKVNEKKVIKITIENKI